MKKAGHKTVQIHKTVHTHTQTPSSYIFVDKGGGVKGANP